MYINSTNIPPIMIINRIYETQNLLSLQLVSFLIGLRIYQHPCNTSLKGVPVLGPTEIPIQWVTRILLPGVHKLEAKG